MAKSSNLTAKQQRFVLEYLIYFNASKAALRAGYSPKTAFRIGQECLQKPAIQQAIAASQKKTANKLEVTRESLAAEAAKLAYYDPTKPGAWSPDWVKASDKRAAIADLCKMFGYNEPDKIAGTIGVGVIPSFVAQRINEDEGASALAHDLLERIARADADGNASRIGVHRQRSEMEAGAPPPTTQP